MGPVVPVHHQLMGSGNQLQVVGVVELLGDILSERVTSTSRRDAPTASVIRVGPQQITNGSIIGILKIALFIRKLTLHEGLLELCPTV